MTDQAKKAPDDLVDVSPGGYIAIESTQPKNVVQAAAPPEDLIDVDPDYVSRQVNPYNAVTGVATGAAAVSPLIEEKLFGTDLRNRRSLETYLRSQIHHKYPSLDLASLEKEVQKVTHPKNRVATMHEVQDALRTMEGRGYPGVGPVDLSTYEKAKKPTTTAGKIAQPIKKTGEFVEALNPFLGQGYGSKAFRTVGRAGLGFGAAYEGAEAYNKALEGDYSGATGSASTSAGLGLLAVPNPYAKGVGAVLAGVPFASNFVGNANAAPMTKEEASGMAFDIGTGLLGPVGMALSPSQLGHGTLRKRDEPRRPGESVLKGSTLPPEMRAQGGLVHLADGGQPQFGEARAYEPSYSEKIRDYAAKHIGREQANRLFAGPNARIEDNFNPVSLALQTPGAIADAASGFVKAGKEGDYLGGMGHYLMGALNVAPMIKPAAHVVKSAARKFGPKIAESIPKFSAGRGVVKLAEKNLKLPSQVFRAAPEQTVTDPLRNAFPGIYQRPDVIAKQAAERVAPESPALKQLFGVTRDDLYEMGKGRVGNISGVLPGAAANPKGSKAAIAVMNPQNEKRLLDVLSESEKYPALVKGMDPWYIMDPAYKRLEELVGPEEAVKKYRQLNTLTGMASPGSDVLTEMNRGTAANYLATQGRFDDFVNYAGQPFGARGAGFPQDLRAVMGHPYHKTAQATPMQKYLESGEVQMSSPKVPMYIDASGVPATGFQTDMPVGDAHWSRAVGLADTRGTATRKGKEVVPGASVSNPEMSQLGPWWRDKIASQVGLESVPAQARAWGAFSPQTGVESPIGAPKLELLSMKIMEAANRYGVSPEQARDMILKGEGYAGKAEGGSINSYAPGGKVGAAKKFFDEARAAYQDKFTPGFYHASPANNIKSFDPSKGDRAFPTEGVTFGTREPKFADSFLDMHRNKAGGFDYNKGSTVYPININLGKHFVPGSPEGSALIDQYIAKMPANPDAVMSAAKRAAALKAGAWDVMEDPKFLQHLRDTGHDTFTVMEGGVPNVGVFNPKNIRGRFAKFNPEDAESPDFMKAEGGPVQHFQAGKRVLSSGLEALQNKIKAEGRTPVVPVPNRWFSQPEKFPHVQGMVNKTLENSQLPREAFHSGAFIDPRTGQILDRNIYNDVGVLIDPNTGRPMMSAGKESGIEMLDPKTGSYTKSNLVRQSLFKPTGGDPMLGEMPFIATIEKGGMGHKYALGTEYATPTEMYNTMTGANPTLRPRSRGDVFGMGDVVGQVQIGGRGIPHDVYEKLFVAPKGSDVPGVKLSKKTGGKVKK